MKSKKKKQVKRYHCKASMRGKRCPYCGQPRGEDRDIFDLTELAGED